MRNLRRRKEILVFAVLLSSSTDAVSGSKFKTLYNVLFRHINVLDTMYAQAVPDKAQRDKEINQVRLVVNQIVPMNYNDADDEWKLWFVLQLLHRMIASGWAVPRDPLLSEFVQSMYHVSMNYNLANPPTKGWINKVAQAPEILRAKGLF